MSNRRSPASSKRKPARQGRKNRPGTRRRRSGGWRRLFLKLLLVGLVAGGGYLVYLDAAIRSQFEGKRWSLPAQVFARPLELYASASLTADELESELKDLGYRPVPRPRATGQYGRSGNRIEVMTRGFDFWDGREPARHLRVGFDDQGLVSLAHGESGGQLGVVRLEPLWIGGIYPAHGEDRVLVRLGDVPDLLIETLLAVEDRGFYGHSGVSFRGIARALWANLKALAVVQGGSTLTQQLVKNYFLSSERTLARKTQEALMALLLEFHYSKDEILEAYLNEIYLGQEGTRAIHGFGLASHFYFAKPLQELGPAETALLVGMVRGPSYYNPRRHPERAITRRNAVIGQLEAQAKLGEAEATSARSRPLGVTREPPGGSSTYPAYMDLVRRQLRRDYRDEDLTSEGLRIFTSLDPRVQRQAERALATRLVQLEKSRGLPAASLEGGTIVTSREGGEVFAVVGGRRARFAGFNRVLDAVRPIGSLVKPAVYLTALASGRYTLATLLEDAAFQVKGGDGRIWAPENYDHQSHGAVPLVEALAKSYNLATARLGLELGLKAVLDTLHELGVRRELAPYPSVLLGALELSPLEVAQMYQSLASGGFRTPLRAIRAVTTAEGQPLTRYPLSVAQVADPVPVYLVTVALQEVVRTGTGASSGLAHLSAAGKTGTTDELRDSWFAGFTGDYVGVVWVGRDDNKPAGLSGASGALRVWSDTMKPLRPRPLELVPPAGVEVLWVDRAGRLSAAGCDGATTLPFAQGVRPDSLAPCLERADRTPGNGGIEVIDWFKELFR